MVWYRALVVVAVVVVVGRTCVCFGFVSQRLDREERERRRAEKQRLREEERLKEEIDLYERGLSAR